MSPETARRESALDEAHRPTGLFSSFATASSPERNAIASLVVVVPLEEGAVEPLRSVLAATDEEVRSGQTPLTRVEGLHVARWVVLPDRVRRRGLAVAPSLVMYTVFDGPREQHLDRLVKHARSMLDRIYGSHCAAYPRSGDSNAVRSFLERHVARGPAAEYIGTPNRSVKAIELQELLARRLAGFVREQKQVAAKKLEDLPNPHLFLRARLFVKDTLKEEAPDLAAFAAQAPPQPATRGLLVDLLSAIVESQVAATLSIGVSVGVLGFGACLAVWLRIPLGAKPILGFAGAYIAALVGIAAILAALWAVAIVFVVEPREALRWVPVPRQTFKNYDNYLKEADNERPGMNRLTIVTDVKGGVLRALTLRLVLWVVGFRARRNVEGRLQGVETIHFAQWRLVDGGRRLLFMSNYDGRALDYFADFSDNAAPGLNAIWGNTEGFPPTTAFLGNGARDLEEFQNAARMHQIATDVWYCGYPTRRFTTRRINDNWRIHQLLNGYPTPSEVDEWVDMLEGRPP